METSVSIGKRIRYYRLLKGLSQEQLALLAGLNPAFVGHLERGLKSPTVTTLQKIVNALEITFEELFSEAKKEEFSKKEQAIEKIVLSVRELDEDEITRISDIVKDIVKLIRK